MTKKRWPLPLSLRQEILSKYSSCLYSGKHLPHDSPTSLSIEHIIPCSLLTNKEQQWNIHNLRPISKCLNHFRRNYRFCDVAFLRERYKCRHDKFQNNEKITREPIVEYYLDSSSFHYKKKRTMSLFSCGRVVHSRLFLPQVGHQDIALACERMFEMFPYLYENETIFHGIFVSRCVFWKWLSCAYRKK